MFAEKHIARLIELGWAPKFNDALQITGFDKFISPGQSVVYPAGCGRLLRNTVIMYDCCGNVVGRQYVIIPNREAICA